MRIGRRAGSALLATVATAATIGLFATSALAAPAATTLTVKVSGGGTFTAASTKTILTDVTSAGPINVTCTSTKKTPASTAAGNIPNGTTKGAAPVKIGTTSKLTFNNCTGPLGVVKTKVLKEPYVTSIDSTTNSKGQTDGIISGIDTSVSTTGCTFTVTGSSPGYYTNGKHTLTMTPTPPVKPLVKAQLTISGVKKGTCAGVVLNGQHPTFSATFTLSKNGTIKSS